LPLQRTPTPMSFFDQVKQSLIDILILLQSLTPPQKEALVRFERCEVDPTQQNLPQVIQQATENQMEQLVQFSQYENDYQRANNDEFLKTLTKAQISSFGCVFRLLLLQETLFKFFSCDEVLVLIEMCRMSSFPADLQLRSLQQFQQFLSGILPETLNAIHDTVQEATDQAAEANKIIFQLLESYQDQSLLAQPLAQLLTTDLDTMMHIQEFFPKLQPLQLVQIVRLMQMDNQWNILEIRQLLSPDQKGWMGLQGLLDQDETMGIDEPRSEKDSFSLTIIEQPPERTVYKRCLKPNPTVLIQSSQQPNLLAGESLCIVPTLYRFDTNEPVPFLTGDTPVSSNIGSSAIFKRLKVTKTSHQLDDTLFFLQFELRKTDGRKQSETIAFVQTKPFTVVSHSTLLPQAAAILPTVNEVVPGTGSTEGGSRVVIIGLNFEDSPGLVVKFDNIPVVPEFHGTGTLICLTPRHVPAQVKVTVANNGKQFGNTNALFTYEDSQQMPGAPVSQSIQDMTEGFSQSDMESIFGTLQDIGLTEELLSSGFSPFEPVHFASALGKKDLLTKLLSTGKASANSLDAKGNNGLYWALYYGHEDLLAPFVHAGVDINNQNEDGTTLLHLATKISPQLVAKLIYLGAWVNTSDYEGRSPLHIAVANGNLDSVRVLLRCGAFINALDNEDDTAIHYAVREERADLVQFLIAEGISVNAQNEDGETALHIAIATRNTDVLRVLLQSKKCNLNIQDNTGASPLLVAAELGLRSCVEQLLQNGSNINQADRTGRSPLDTAKNTQEALVQLLLSHGAKNLEHSTSPSLFSPFSSPSTFSTPFTVHQ